MIKRENLRGKVQTVRWLMNPETLGPTLMQEHILCDLTPPGRFKPEELEVEITLKTHGRFDTTGATIWAITD